MKSRMLVQCSFMADRLMDSAYENAREVLSHSSSCETKGGFPEKTVNADAVLPERSMSLTW